MKKVRLIGNTGSRNVEITNGRVQQLRKYCFNLVEMIDQNKELSQALLLRNYKQSGMVLKDIDHAVEERNKETA